MALKIFIFLSILLVSVKTSDLRLGYVNQGSRLIYSEIKEASPAIWQRSDEIKVDTSGNEIISAIIVKDLRDDNEGQVDIVLGGIGTRSVTIGLKSPTVFRGYKFQIEVYAENQNARYNQKGGYYDTNNARVYYPQQTTPNYYDGQYARKY